MLHDIRVDHYMAKQPILLKPEMSIDAAIKTLLQHKISGAPVVHEGVLVGIFSEADCLGDMLQAGYYEMNAGLVRDVMSTATDTIHPSQSILDAADVFQQRGRRRLPVVDDLGVVVGQISRRDVLQALDDLAHRQKQNSAALP